jgi:hypothetical protein
MDLPTVAPYFFVPPAWADAEARAMLDGISTEDYQNAMRGTAERLKSASPWDRQTLADALHAGSRAEAIKPAKFMTALRHAMSGTKVNPFSILGCVESKSLSPTTERAERRRNDGCIGQAEDDRSIGRRGQLVPCLVYY